MEAGQPNADFRKLAKIAEELHCCVAIPEPSKQEVMTFEALANAWTSGELTKRYPDHVSPKKSYTDDASRFKRLFPSIGSIRLAQFTLEDAETAMGTIPSEYSPSTRRQYAQLICRVLSMAAYPCKLIPSSPIPKGFKPKATRKLAKSYLRPKEDARLISCPDIPLERRLLWAFLAREGMRISEALSLSWSNIDFEDGIVVLDENKTNEPRAWALNRGVYAALILMRGAAKGSERVFRDVPTRRYALVFREDLKTAGITRAELFAGSESRLAIRVHDLWGTFVTLSLANGESETWVQSRTGHTSSQMLNRYRRDARTAEEVKLGELAPMHEAIPELRQLAIAQRQNESQNESQKENSLSDFSKRLFWAPAVGLEPTTSGLTVRCSAN